MVRFIAYEYSLSLYSPFSINCELQHFAIKHKSIYYYILEGHRSQKPLARLFLLAAVLRSK